MDSSTPRRVEIDGDIARVRRATPATSRQAEACVAATDRAVRPARHPRQQRRDQPVHRARSWSIDEGRFDKTFQVNVTRPDLLVARPPGRSAMKDNGGVIMNIASVGGLRSEAAARDLQPHEGRADPPHPAAGAASSARSVRVVGIAPGLVKTDFAQMLVDNFGETLARSDADSTARRARRHRPSRRRSSPATSRRGSPARPT